MFNKLSNTTKFILISLGFSSTLCLSLYLFSLSFKYEFSIVSFLLTFFCSGIFAFLFFNILYQRILFSEAERTLEKLKNFKSPKKIEENFDYTYDTSGPIEKLNAEILQLAEERQKEVEHLEKLESYRKEYLGNVSHELKTPIFNIQGYVSTLIEGGIYDETINMEYLKRADKSVDRMINIIDDLETISQLETGSMVLDLEKINIEKLATDVIEQLEIQAQKKSIQLVVSSPEEKVGKVLADKFRIRQVFANLISNSIKYGKENGKVEVKLFLVHDKIGVEISDNGIGIEKQHLSRLFERFYRVDKGRSREQGGTGLGLSIVKHIIEAHDQQITVDSEVGVGTKFTFTLRKA